MCLIDGIVISLVIISAISSVVTAIMVGSSSVLSWWLVPKVAVLAPVTSLAGFVTLVLAAGLFRWVTSCTCPGNTPADDTEKAR